MNIRPPTLALHISWCIRIGQTPVYSVLSFIYVKVVGVTHILQRGVSRSHAFFSFFFFYFAGDLGILSSWIFSVFRRAFPI
jgi:hypothetical protein